MATIAVADAINPDVKTFDLPMSADIPDPVFSAFTAGKIPCVPGRFLWPPPAPGSAEQPAPVPVQQQQQQLGGVKQEAVPIIDLSVLQSSSGREEEGGGQRRSLVAKAIGEAARGWGFFQIVNHGVPVHTVEAAQEYVRRLFALPFEQKLAGCYPQDGLSTLGYRVGGVPNRKSSRLFLWQQNLTLFNEPNSILEYSSKIWQDAHEAEQFSALVYDYIQAVEKVAEVVVELLCEALGVDGEEVKRMCGGADSFTTLRLNYYPCCPEPAKTIGVVPHQDPSVISVLHQDDVGGLEVLKDGQWVRVEPLPEALVVNIGDLFQAMSNNVYPSVLHRAQVHEEEHRLSMVLFYSPLRNATIAPLPQLLDAQHPPIYRRFSFAEYLAVFKSRSIKGGTHLTRFRTDFVEESDAVEK